MWQRIQTLYLAIATILIGSLFFCRFASIVGPMGDTVTIAYHEKLPYLLFIIILFAANLFALFLYKFRPFQIRVCIFTVVLLIGFQLWLIVDIARHLKEMSFSFTATFPILASILDTLAIRNILIDETLVKSASRLRSAKKKSDSQKEKK